MGRQWGIRLVAGLWVFTPQTRVQFSNPLPHKKYAATVNGENSADNTGNRGDIGESPELRSAAR